MTTAMRMTLDGPLMRSGALANLTELGIHAQRHAEWVHRRGGAGSVQQLPNVHEDGRPGAPPVILLNGWTASGLSWPHQLVAGLARSFHVLRIDNRGTGWSRGMRHPFTIGDLADDARRVIEQRGLRRVIVVGVSMGGMIAQELALRAPEHLDHAVLLATRPPAPAHTHGAQFVTASLMGPPEPGQSLGDHVQRAWGSITGPGFTDRNPAMVAELISSIVARPTPRAAVFDQARAIAAWSGASRLKRLVVPSTVVHGVADPLIPVRNGIRLAQLIPDADYVELPGVGHLVPHEAPAAVEAVVRRVATG